ncbi:MAG: 2-oxo-3-(phosphooxy)propyl 3-oxoalkanoate synthase [Solirubrobacteraceae bacterium]|jgi:hypothetical protein|nr:2-oxo-3-(phosphooxy)propyl 3-oxoalkanoate synthase [Solirubrobacteraceae bacterium]
MGHDTSAVHASRASRELSFEQTVPRGLVHRMALGEVYVADSLKVNDAEFVLAIQIPRAHCVWFDRRVAYHDPLSTAEAARQAVYVVVHRHVGVPPGLTFSLQRLQLRVADLDAYRDRGAPLQGLLTLRLVEQARHGSSLGTMSFEGDLRVDGTVAMTLRGDLVFLSPDDYAALRAYQRRRNPPASWPPPAVGPALDAAASGRRDQRNCVLGEPAAEAASDGAIRYPLIVDQHHPSFFDHGYDHAPGPLIIEAYRQAAIVTAHRGAALPSPVAAIVGCEAAFTDFAELDSAIECTAAVDARFDDGRVGVKVGLHQFGKEVSTGRVELRPYPDGTPVG